jgi:hypothetical protein
MDFWKALSELHLERERLNRIIATLEGMTGNGNGKSRPRSRRGRKGMPEDERRVVSERMRAYWARRRSAQSSC